MNSGGRAGHQNKNGSYGCHQERVARTGGRAAGGWAVGRFLRAAGILAAAALRAWRSQGELTSQTVHIVSAAVGLIPSTRA